MNAQTLALDGFVAPKTLKESLFYKLQKHVENSCFWADFQKIKIFNFFEKNRFCLFWEGFIKTSSRNLSKERVFGGYRAISWVEVGKRLWFWLVACFFKLKLVFWSFVKKGAHFLSLKALISVFPLSLILFGMLSNVSQDEFGVYRLDWGWWTHKPWLWMDFSHQKRWKSHFFRSSKSTLKIAVFELIFKK